MNMLMKFILKNGRVYIIKLKNQAVTTSYFGASRYLFI